MKKIISAVFIIVLSLSLCSCSEQSSPSVSSVISNSEKDVSNVPTIDLKMLTEPDGSFAQTGAGNDNGYYSLLYNTDGSVNVLYTDYSTAQTVYLSNQISSTHKDSSDTSYFETGLNYMFLINDKLYCVQSPLPQFSGGLVGKIYELGLNGENRKEVYTMASSEVMQRGVATDGTNIYTVLESVDLQGKVSSSFCKISLENAVRENLFTLEPYNYLMGVYEDKLIFKSTNQETSTCTLYEFDINGENKRELMSWNVDTLFGAVKDGKFFYFTYATGECFSLDFKTLESTLLADNLPTTGLSNTTYLGPIFDNHLTYQTGRSEAENPNLIIYDSYGIDLQSGACKKVSLPLKGQQGGYIRLQAESADMFLATIEIKNQKVLIEGMGGEKYEETVPILISGLITKDDYWNSNPQYINIDISAIY